VLDRASSFADPKVIALLQTRAIPVALDVWYEERRHDAAGEFYLKIAKQREGYDPEKTTQGFYICTPSGEVLSAWNNRDPAKLLRNLEHAVESYKPADVAASESHDDARFARKPPEGGAVVDVFARILEAEWPPAKDEWQAKFRESIGRDHLWITSGELAALARGEIAPALASRIARYHLIDNTRGEPPMWAASEVRKCDLSLARDGDAWKLAGQVQLATAGGDRGYEARLDGFIVFDGAKLTRFDVVARGQFHGEGRYTQGAPPGEFTLAIAFRVAPASTATAVPPQGARDLNDYLGR
jgi:hypothetical protein